MRLTSIFSSRRWQRSCNTKIFFTVMLASSHHFIYCVNWKCHITLRGHWEVVPLPTIPPLQTKPVFSTRWCSDDITQVRRGLEVWVENTKKWKQLCSLKRESKQHEQSQNTKYSHKGRCLYVADMFSSKLQVRQRLNNNFNTLFYSDIFRVCESSQMCMCVLCTDELQYRKRWQHSCKTYSTWAILLDLL